MTTTHRPRAKVTMVSDTEVLITREFEAPARLVYEASTKPEYMARWYGPRAMTMKSATMDVRPGGTFLWVLATADGTEYSWKGVYQEVVPHERMVYAEQFLLGDTWTNDVINYVTMDEKDGKTLLTVRLVYKTREDRDGHLGAGMEEGMAESHQRLDELLATMA